jgi:hypothetical protein
VAEHFKIFEELLTPDSRSQYRELGPGSLEGFHRVMADINLNIAVPEAIRSHFITARHLVVYSWFVYPFVMVAQSHAYTTLEYALRERLGRGKEDHPPSLHHLWQIAIARGLLQDDCFRDWPGRHTSPRDTPPSTEWVTLITKSLSALRNDLAHGSYSLYPEHWRVLAFVADAVNQLYP